jgi:UDP-N-acetylglucosamine 4-epimerase
LQLFELLKDNLAKFDIGIKDIEPIFGNVRAGDVPHSLASIKKAEELLNYHPLFNISEGLEKTVSWYWNNLKR